MPAKRIIILDNRTQTNIGTEAPKTYRAALWADVPAARQPFYVTTASSAWTGASGADTAAIQTGAVAERVVTASLPFNVTLLQAQAVLQQMWTDYQAEITAANPWNRYGSFWDGATWTAGGVA